VNLKGLLPVFNLGPLDAEYVLVLDLKRLAVWVFSYARA
jgi:hypothetical protein